MTDIDDKIIQRCIDQGQSSHQGINSLTKKYETEFFNDMKKLNVMSPNVVLRVTEHIPAIIRYIEQIINNKFAYITDDGVYFDVSKCKKYGKLGPIPTVNDDFSSGEHTHFKKNPRDFVLWKRISNQNEPAWASPWGNGRPGWHIECSAMTHSYFGPHMNIHSGGIDLKFPHHTNEIAQSEAHNNSDSWVDTWLHTGHLYIEGRKMSKSLKNFISISEYYNAKISSNPSADFRLFCLQSRYSHNVYYTVDRIHDAAKYRSKIENYLQLTEQLVSHIEANMRDLVVPSHYQGTLMDGAAESVAHSYLPGKKLTKSLNEVKVKVDAALRSDFDTPTVLDLLSNLVGDAQQYRLYLTSNSLVGPLEPLHAVTNYILYIFDIFGIDLKVGQQESREQAKQDEIVTDLIRFRSSIRQIALGSIKNNETTEICKNIMKKCDEVRDQLKQNHVVVEDTKDSSGLWRYNSSK